VRTVVLDTETTGLDPFSGDRIIEICCLEIIGRKTTGNIFHHHLNPGFLLSEEVCSLLKISNELLADKPKFSQIVDDFLCFIGKSRLVTINAQFELRFLNQELANCGFPWIEEARMLDVLPKLRKLYPKQPHLDAIARKLGGGLGRN